MNLKMKKAFAIKLEEFGGAMIGIFEDETDEYPMMTFHTDIFWEYAEYPEDDDGEMKDEMKDEIKNGILVDVHFLNYGQVVFDLTDNEIEDDSVPYGTDVPTWAELNQ